MRVLFIAAQLSGPPIRGDQVRARQLLRGLSSRHSVTVLNIEHARADRNAPPPLPAPAIECERLITVALWRSGMACRALAALLRPGSRIPLQAALYDSPTLKRTIRALVAESQFDVAHVQLARLGPLLSALDGVPVVVDMIDALSQNMRSRAAVDRPPLRWIAAIEAKRLAAYERKLCRHAAAAIVCSANDRNAIGKLRNLHVVSNGVELPPYDEYAPDSSAPRLIFTGNLGYFPNVDAASWFIERVLPDLRREAPQISLDLVGARPARRLSILAARTPGVTLVGPVDDMHPYLQRATIAVAPMRAGSGQQTKVLEAMAAGKPVVATPSAVAGLDVVDGEHLLVASSEDEMRDAILRLLRQWPLRIRLASAARSHVEERYPWGAAVDATEAIWDAARVHGDGRQKRR